ncbi:MAG: aromatic amino acid lyase [Alphaproteobacteria bacterium]
MTVTLNTRDDFNLETLRRVALEGEDVRFSPAALKRMQKAHDTFQKYVDASRDIFIYGVTSGGGPDAKNHRSPEEMMKRRRAANPFRSLSFSRDGDYPEYAIRAAVFAILNQFIEGNTATYPKRAQAIADMLKKPLPRVPNQGVTVPGEILASMTLFRDVQRFPEAGHQAGSGNGNQFTTGFAGVSAIAQRRRLDIAGMVQALSVEAMNAPLEAYDPALKALWGDSHEGAALDALNRWLKGAPTKNRRFYQAPVSWRIIPRVLGQAYRAVAQLEDVARVSLRQISSNPAYALPDKKHPLGHTFSSGGYHNAIAPPAMDAVAAAWVDVAALSHRHSVKLHKGEVSLLPDRLLPEGKDYMTASSTTYLEYVPNGFIEEMRRLAQPSLLSPAEPAASEQDDISAPGFLAYNTLEKVSVLFDSVLAVEAAVASQALWVTKRDAPRPLRPFLEAVRAHFPPVEVGRLLGDDARRLSEAFSAATLSGDMSLGTKPAAGKRKAA